MIECVSSRTRAVSPGMQHHRSPGVLLPRVLAPHNPGRIYTDFWGWADGTGPISGDGGWHLEWCVFVGCQRVMPKVVGVRGAKIRYCNESHPSMPIIATMPWHTILLPTPPLTPTCDGPSRHTPGIKNTSNPGRCLVHGATGVN
jgi:hypothetical protein